MFLRVFFTVADLEILFFSAYLKLFYFYVYKFAVIINFKFFFVVHSVLGQP